MISRKQLALQKVLILRHCFNGSIVNKYCSLESMTAKHAHLILFENLTRTEPSWSRAACISSSSPYFRVFFGRKLSPELELLFFSLVPLNPSVLLGQWSLTQKCLGVKQCRIHAAPTWKKWKTKCSPELFSVCVRKEEKKQQGSLLHRPWFFHSIFCSFVEFF